MATWKKVIVSGSNISDLKNDSNYLSSAGEGIISASSVSSTAQGEFTASFNGVLTELDLGLTSGDDVQFNSVTASFQGDVNGTADTASYVAFGDVENLTETSASIAVDIANLTAATYDLDIQGDSGGVLSITNAETLDIAGGTNITTAGSGNEITVNLDSKINLTEVTASIISASVEIIGDLTGDVTGDVTGDLTGNADTATTVAASSTGQGKVSVGSNANIGLGVEVTDSPVFADLRLTGNLTVEGTRTELNVANLNVEDAFILLNSGSASGDTGIIFGGANTTDINTGSAIFYDDSDSVFSYAADVEAGDVTATAASKLGNIQVMAGAGSHNMAAATFQGVGTIAVDNGECIWIQTA
jgi:hypothetical protein